MTYSNLIQLYFERSIALQWYWTIYVIIIGGLLAFSSLRQRKDTVTTLLLTVLYLCFAYKNLGAIEDTTAERAAILSVVKQHVPSSDPSEIDVKRLGEVLEPTLVPSTVAEVRYFHAATDLLTIAAIWAMEWRRRKAPASPDHAASTT
jgi:hypothetical protein